MDEEKFWLLLSLKLSGEATEEELEALGNMLQNNPGLGLQAQMLMQMWRVEEEQEKQTDDFFDRHLQRLSNRPDIYPSPAITDAPVVTLEERKKDHRRKWLWPLIGAAAGIAIITGIFYSGTFHSAKKNEGIFAKNTVTTRKGSKSNIQLPDGTMVWLNADSKVTYDEKFRGDFREVTLAGEAYFDVVKDQTRPFIIHTHTIDIKVLGTAFNVRAYATEKNTETALFRGSVEVTLHNNPEKKIILKPNEKLLVNNTNPDLLPQEGKESRNGSAVSIAVGKVHFEKKDSSALETLWMKNKLVFDAETLEQVAQKIERWYDVKVIINGGDELRLAEYSGIFDNEELDQVMEALKISGNFRYTINKDTVTIR
jgi:ferric-dicitrate binding protein FerR (iron transport regulator)